LEEVYLKVLGKVWAVGVRLKRIGDNKEGVAEGALKEERSGKKVDAVQG